MGNSCSTEHDCRWNFTEGAVVPFEADPDIAGIGAPSKVIAAFFISAWLTFVIALFAYNLVDGVMDEDTHGVVTIDLKIRDWVLKKLQARAFNNVLSYIRVRFTKEKMQEVCLMLADQQLVTGAAILIVGYVTHCEITQYHFCIAANLTTVSFATYQSVLLIVHDVLQTNVRRGWRTVWIAILFGSVVTLKLIFYNNNFLWPQHYGRSMDCFWRQLSAGLTPPYIPYIVVGIVGDLLSAFFIAYCLYPEIWDLRLVRSVNRAANKLFSLPTYLYLKVARHVRQPSKTRWLWKLIEWPSWLLFIIFFTLREVCCSLYFDLARIFLYLYQTTTTVEWARNTAAANGRNGEEDSWGFGQILPLLLLALPLFSLFETLYGTPDSATALDNAQCAASTGATDSASTTSTTSTDETTKFEEILHGEKWFVLWVFIVLCSLFGVIVFASETLPMGMPI